MRCSLIFANYCALIAVITFLCLRQTPIVTFAICFGRYEVASRDAIRQHFKSYAIVTGVRPNDSSHEQQNWVSKQANDCNMPLGEAVSDSGLALIPPPYRSEGFSQLGSSATTPGCGAR
jgi:hypothetical protein